MKEVLINLDGQAKLDRRIQNTWWTPIKFIDKRNGIPIWLMRCKCGIEKEVLYKSYNNGTSLSCGCYRRAYLQNRRGSNRKSIGESACNQLLLIYQRRARKKNIEFSLSREEFLNLTSSNCYYCGYPPHQVLDRGKLSKDTKKVVSAYVYNGVDRKDNTIGYTAGNSVSCCRMCNYAKSDMDLIDFEQWLDQVAEFRFKKENKQVNV